MTSQNFTARLLDWYDSYGRHDLPWQKRRNAYRVWIAEIMLQQTQVGTVVPYYRRFMQTFPTLSKLASASLDRVMGCWAGLGYYSRARNLHKAAGIIKQQHGGRFPQTFDEVLALPGIGKSTAGAILAQVHGQRHPILDGNVKRVLCRYQAIEGWPGTTAVQKKLWQLAERYTPSDSVADYTQAIMDLGATLCIRANPQCGQCPVHADCAAFVAGEVSRYPQPRPRRTMPVKATRLLILTDADSGQILLEKRPPSGIWGGLWSLPELEPTASVESVCRHRWGLRVLGVRESTQFRHTFSHYHLDITPCQVQVRCSDNSVHERDQTQWCPTDEIANRGLAAPVARILAQLPKT